MGLWFLFAVGGVFFLLWLFGGGDKPAELDADVWAADPAIRARNLQLKIAAKKTGAIYVNPDALTKMEASCAAARASGGPIVIANPNAEGRLRRLARCCGLHAPHWEDMP